MHNRPSASGDSSAVYTDSLYLSVNRVGCLPLQSSLLVSCQGFRQDETTLLVYVLMKNIKKKHTQTQPQIQNSISRVACTII